MTAHRVLKDALLAARDFQKFNDPGDAGTIRVDRQLCWIDIITGASGETRTLAQPPTGGLLCAINLDTDGGGDLTLTVTGGYNEDGDTSVTLGDAGDFVLFASFKKGTSYYWSVVAQRGTNVVMEDLSVDTLTVAGNALILEDMTPGTGISTGTGTICEHRVSKIGGLIKTEILIDLTGLNSGGTAGDIIGKDGGTANCHIGQITAAVNGTIIAGRVTCFETPAGGDPDVDIWGSVDEATGAQDAAISSLTGEGQLINHGDWTAEDVDHLSALPDADGYLYLACGAATDADYTAGILLIEMWGV